MSVVVERKQLYECLRFLSKAKRGKLVPDARVTFSGNSLLFEYSGARSEVSGEGNKFGTVIMKGEDLKKVYRVLPKAELVEVRVKEGRIYFGNLRFPLVEEYVQGSIEINLPVKPSKIDILGLIFHYPLEKIKSSGWMPLYTKYDKEKNDRVYAAFEKLKEYGVSVQEIEKLVEAALQVHGS